MTEEIPSDMCNLIIYILETLKDAYLDLMFFLFSCGEKVLTSITYRTKVLVLTSAGFSQISLIAFLESSLVSKLDVSSSLCIFEFCLVCGEF